MRSNNENHKANGIVLNGGGPSNRLRANGWPVRHDDKQSTLSRYRSTDRRQWPGGGGGSSGPGAQSSTLRTGGGEPSSRHPLHPPCSYHAVRRACRERGVLFEDPDFPPGPRAIWGCHKFRPPIHPIVWMRPHEMCQRPQFIINDDSDSDGGLGRCDLEAGLSEGPGACVLGAISALASLTPRLLRRVVPTDQSFEPGSYSGLFRFRFWHFGEWTDVVVDDRLPTFRGRLVYLHSANTTEFWAALLEKAYAKLYGCYESVQQGWGICGGGSGGSGGGGNSGGGSSNGSSGTGLTQALQDLTGGVVQSFDLRGQDRFLTFQVLSSAVPRSTLLIVSILPEKDSRRQLRLRNGLLTHHTYSVTGMARVRGGGGGVVETPLVRLRSSGGVAITGAGGGEWTGPWSERSWEWDGLSERDKELLSARIRNDGEFWMSFEDFARHFTRLDLVHVGPDDWMSEPAIHSKQPWRAVLARRRWRSGYNAGGGPSHPETTSMNPQFHIQIPRTLTNKCHVVVSVTQYYETNSTLESFSKKKRPLHAIGFAVYEVPHTMTRLTPQFVSEKKPLDVTNHSVTREVVTFFTLPPGDYIVVPQTNVPNCDGKFLLRILTDEQSNIWEVNEDNMVFRNISSELVEDSFMLPDGRSILNKLIMKYPPEIDASHLLKILKTYWKAYLIEKPSYELCKSLIMLRDYNISGRINLLDITVLMQMLHFWRIAFQKYDRSHSGKTSSYNLRLLLWEAGSTVSNKVLECLVLRFAKNKILTSECFIMAMVRLHLAHERYHNLDTKMKGNPLSLEEMILMTIYS
ncbi:calpain-1 catalytic subunit-like isoform X2 [Ischnura elegans]|uniref:calpain-1 catalytic subunit-like isoform X2 n=1 Tax=Ischnura elegans TaxID=197161 RepID=UPI001ED8809A|nr:calpain-1 catalytic subunit-like isoform X2 [Ischnura elegans]